MTIKEHEELLALMEIGRICGLTLKHMQEHVRPGITTLELDQIGEAFMNKQGAKSAPRVTYKYPGGTCISINSVAAHGIPGSYEIKQGDLVNIDVSAEKNGFFADTGASMGVEPVSDEARKLLEFGQAAFQAALGAAKAGAPINAIGKAAETIARKGGFSIIRELPGHGVGRGLHEPPSVPGYFDKRFNTKLKEGQVLTIEPFLAYGAGRIKEEKDGWTLRTVDNRLVVQFEHTVVITKEAPLLITKVD
jgi:methionyl aminopeptidase